MTLAMETRGLCKRFGALTVAENIELPTWTRPQGRTASERITLAYHVFPRLKQYAARGGNQHVHHRAVAARTRAPEVLRHKLTRSGGPRMRWRVRVPSRAITDGMTDLMLVVREPVSWSDDRQRGLHLAAVEIRRP